MSISNLVVYLAPPHFTGFPHAKRCSSSKNSGSIRLPFMMFQASRGALSSDIRRLAVKLDVPVLRDSCHSDNMGEQYQWEFLRIHSDLSENSAESHGNFRTWSWREKKPTCQISAGLGLSSIANLPVRLARKAQWPFSPWLISQVTGARSIII